jgi:hypothetical protein
MVILYIYYAALALWVATAHHSPAVLLGPPIDAWRGHNGVPLCT